MLHSKIIKQIKTQNKFKVDSPFKGLEKKNINLNPQSQFKVIQGSNLHTESNTIEKHKLKDIIQQIQIKKIVRQWKKFIPSRMLKIMNVWHYNILDDKSIIIQNQNKKKQIKEDLEESDETQYKMNILTNIQKNYEICYFLKQIKQFLNKFINQIPIFQANQKFKLIWDILHSFIIMIFQFFVPLKLTFQINFYDILNTFFSAILFFLLCFDILINLNTSFYKKGQQIKKRKLIAKQYLKSAFLYDILPVFPIAIDYIFLSKTPEQQKDQFLNYLYFIFILKMKKFFCILDKIQDRYHLNISLNCYLQLLKLIIFLQLIIHYFSCIWILLGKIDREINWLQKRTIYDEKWQIQYINSYYFITLTIVTVGYGDIVPTNLYEMGGNILTMMIGCGVFAYSMNEIGQIIQELREKNKEIKKNLYTISKYMNNKSISSELQYEIREYLMYYWLEESNKDSEKENIIINQLSDSLKQLLILDANNIVLKNSPVFRGNFSQEIINKTVPIIKEFRCTPEEIIFNEGEMDDECIYFIEKGSVELYLDLQNPYQFNDQIKSIKLLQKGDCFGKLEFFTGLHRIYSARSLEFTTLLMIKRNDFLDILQENPSDYHKFCQIRDQILFNSNFQTVAERLIRTILEAY